jgi:apolipoprotein N-acyltransferase
MRKRSFFLASLSGVLAALSFPHWNVWPLAWVGLVPLLCEARGMRPKEALFAGWAAGAVHFGVLLYWLTDTMQVYGRLPLIVAVGVMVLLVLYLAGFWALFLWGLVVLRAAGAHSIWLAPILWTLTEALRSVLLTGFPWALLGYSQWKHLPLVQIADITGIHGVGFLLLGANSAISSLIVSLGERKKRLLSLGGILVAGLLVSAVWYYGEWRISQTEDLSRVSPKLKVGIVQGNMEQSMKWEPRVQEATLSLYLEETRRLALEKGARLVVWPETALPFFFQKEGPLRERLLEAASTFDADIVFGAPAFGVKNGQTVFYNRAYLLGPGGKVLGSYDKTHLVPFGEYLPLRGLFPFIRELITAIGDFSPGESLGWLGSSTGAKLGVTICFESIFPDIFREEARLGAHLFVNLTNDAWFGETAAPYQHLSMLAMRAVENRRWIVRAANTGISATIDPCGRVRSQTPLFERATIVDLVDLVDVNSFYSVHGEIFPWACCATLVAMGLGALARTKRRRRNALARMEGETREN